MVASATRRLRTDRISAKDVLVVELRAMLAEARKPFWRRWAGI